MRGQTIKHLWATGLTAIVAVLVFAVFTPAAFAGDECQKFADGDPLFCAAEDGDAAKIQRLINEGAEVNGMTNSGLSPLHYAALNGHKAAKTAIAALVKAGADINRGDEDGITPLHIAAGYGHTEAIAGLIEAGADVNRANAGGWTPLYWAKINKHPAAVKILIDAGAK